MTRHRFVPRAAAAFGLAVALAFPSPATGDPGGPAFSGLEELPADGFTRDAAAHLLRRAGFDGDPAAIDRLWKLGLTGAVDHLVDYASIEDPLPPFESVAPEDRRAEMRAELGDRNPRDLTAEERNERQKKLRREDQLQFQRLRAWWMARLIASPRPLEERMTLFWHGHFCSGYRDVRNSHHMLLQNRLLRTHATGNFGALVRAIARDPAMLEYLDNRVNRKEHPNENFARELLELFTLGVGHYTENDIKEAARALTGWTLVDGEFADVRARHDRGAKTFLGRTGHFDGDDVIDIVLEQPVAAEYLAGKIFRYFAHDAPSAEVVRGLASTLRDSGYEIRPLLKRLFRSQEFYSARSVGSQVKAPVVLVASLLRAMGVREAVGIAPMLVRAADSMGQSLFEPPNVKGWPGGRDWITTSLLLQRYNVAATIVAHPDEIRRRLRSLPARSKPRFTPAEQEAMDPDLEASGDEDPEREQTRLQQAARSGRHRKGGFDVAKAVAGCSGAAEIVDRLCARFLAVPPGNELRETLIEYLNAAPIDAARLHGVLQLIVSSPEFQLS